MVFFTFTGSHLEVEKSLAWVLPTFQHLWGVFRPKSLHVRFFGRRIATDCFQYSWSVSAIMQKLTVVRGRSRECPQLTRTNEAKIYIHLLLNQKAPIGLKFL